MNDVYPVKIEFDAEESVYIAEFPDLPGCFAPGATVQDAYDRAQDAKDEWIRIAKEQGLPIPTPSGTEEYSGRILLRLPATLHGMLANRARNQVTSLNQYAVHLLSGSVVGDTVTGHIDQLTVKVASLERQLARVARDLEASYSEIAKQLGGTPRPASALSSSTQRIGGAYEAVRGTASTGSWLH